MNIIIVDGQGGGIGCAVIEALRKALPQQEILALGTNSSATTNMLKAGAHQGATGENAILWNAQQADIIIAPIGLYLANSLAGEVSPSIAQALSSCRGEKIAIPVSRCHIHLVGVEELHLKEQTEKVVNLVKILLNH